MKKTLITGATGGLGSEVVDFLLQIKNKQEIVVLVRDTQKVKAQEYAKQNIEVRVADFSDQELLTKAFSGIDTLYFVSGSDIGERMQQHKNVVKAAVDANIDHIVYTSAGRKTETEDSPLYPVMASHINTEKLIKESGIKYTILRHNLYAEVLPMFLGAKEQLLNTKSVYLPAKNGKTAFANRKDLAEAGAKILCNIQSHINKTYLFNGNEPISLEQVANYLSKSLDEPIAYHSPEPIEFEKTMRAAGVPEEGIGMMVMFCLGIAAGEFNSEVNDLEVILGRKTQSIPEFLSLIYQ